MKVNLCKPLTLLDGSIRYKPQTTEDKEKGKEKEPQVLNELLADAMVKQESETSVLSFVLAKKLYSAKGEIELSSKEVTEIEETLKKARFFVLVEAQIRLCLDGNEKKEEKQGEK